MPTNYIPNGYTSFNSIAWGEDIVKVTSILPDGRVVWVQGANTNTPVECIIWDTDGSVKFPGYVGPFGPAQGGTGINTSASTGQPELVDGSWSISQNHVNVKAYGAVGDGVADDAAAIQAAIDSLTTDHGVIFFPLGTYKVTSSLDLTGLTGVLFTGCGYGTEIKLGTTGTPGLDLTNSTRLTFRDLLITSEEDTAAPNVMILMARPVATTSSGWHQFHNCQFEGPTTGTTCKAVIYNYAAELTEFYGCRCYARNPSSVGLYYTSKNDLSVASSFETIATGEQSCVTLLWVGGHIVDYSAETTNAAIPVYLHNCRNVRLMPQWMSTGGDQYIYAMSDGPASQVNNLICENIRCEDQPAGVPKYFVCGNDATTGEGWSIGKIAGCILSCSDAVVKHVGGTSVGLFLGMIEGNEFGSAPTYMLDVGGSINGGIVDAASKAIKGYARYGTIIHNLSALSDVAMGGYDEGGALFTDGLTSEAASIGISYLEGIERTDPDAPAVNRGRLYFRDDGAGKTQLVVRFPTGVVQQIAIEP